MTKIQITNLKFILRGTPWFFAEGLRGSSCNFLPDKISRPPAGGLEMTVIISITNY